MRHRSATVASWKAADVRELLIRLKDEHPTASKSRLFDLFLERVKEDEEYQYATADYAFHNTMNALERFEARPPASLAVVRQQREERQQEVIATAETIRNQILLLNLEMPNGKRMRYCTGEEMAKFGRAYERIAKKVGKTQLVGSVMNETEVRVCLG
jgi:hypothetical protein